MQLSNNYKHSENEINYFKLKKKKRGSLIIVINERENQMISFRPHSTQTSNSNTD